MSATTSKFKVESGIQLLTRITKKPEIKNFYPHLFTTGPEYGDIIEMFSDVSLSHLLTDLICEALTSTSMGKPQLGVMILSSDGNFNYEYLVKTLQTKLQNFMKTNDLNMDKLNNRLCDCLTNFYFLKIYDSTQFYTTIHNLESILMEHPSVSLVIFDTLTAFYWSEQGFKITRMDLYVKNLLQLIRKITKDYKITLLYTRPEYFNTNKDSIEKLEQCSELPKAEQPTYKIQLLHNEDKTYQVIVKKSKSQYMRYFTVAESQVLWT